MHIVTSHSAIDYSSDGAALLHRDHTVEILEMYVCLLYVFRQTKILKSGMVALIRFDKQNSNP